MMNIDDSFKKNKEDLLEEIKEELGLKEEWNYGWKRCKY